MCRGYVVDSLESERTEIHLPAPQDASGATGRFTDPEEGSVAFYSSRGPCYVNSGSGIENRLKPETTAATALQTSTGGINSTRKGMRLHCNKIPEINERFCAKSKEG